MNMRSHIQQYNTIGKISLKGCGRPESGSRSGSSLELSIFGITHHELGTSQIGAPRRKPHHQSGPGRNKPAGGGGRHKARQNPIATDDQIERACTF